MSQETKAAGRPKVYNDLKNTFKAIGAVTNLDGKGVNVNRVAQILSATEGEDVAIRQSFGVLVPLKIASATIRTYLVGDGEVIRGRGRPKQNKPVVQEAHEVVVLDKPKKAKKAKKAKVEAEPVLIESE